MGACDGLAAADGLQSTMWIADIQGMLPDGGPVTGVKTSYSKPVGSRGSALMGHKLFRRIDTNYLEEQKDR